MNLASRQNFRARKQFIVVWVFLVILNGVVFLYWFETATCTQWFNVCYELCIICLFQCRLHLVFFEMRNTAIDSKTRYSIRWYCWWKNSCQPVEVGSLSHYLHGFYTFLLVVWDFWTINSMNNGCCSTYQESRLPQVCGMTYIQYIVLWPLHRLSYSS